ncbi:MAG TPA: carotenoid biosynthesis protein [Ktedonobacteraceae bacterium]|nr:carotenoid biosynthesis protein [Ktedonobacteraceae bacterium]
MRIVKILFFCHLLALTFGLAGLLIALPHPELWANNPVGVAIFNVGIQYTGSLHILFGAATILTFGLLFVGKRKTLIFFCASTLISLSMELLGTSSGFPFGPYAYTSLLGYKILAHVPYSIPLSWFYMGFTSYLLASLIVRRMGWSRPTLWSLLLGAYFLTAWDLSLDPSMASSHLPVQFWIWSEAGPYFGMPVRNLIGWSLTGLIFMSVSRLFWHTNVDTTKVVSWLPFGVYMANTCFAIVLALNAGLWQPLVIAIVFGLLPATLVFLPRSPKPGQPDSRENGIMRFMSHLTVRKGSEAIVRKNLTYKVEGREYIPSDGPVLIVARHFHHLYDGCILLATVPRKLHILIALDWISRPFLRRLMEYACRLVKWPVVLRSERLKALSDIKSAYRVEETQPYLRKAVRLATNLLCQGETLVIFPEAYPNIDPSDTPKTSATAFLPFRPGFARLVEVAERHGQQPVAIIPAGLNYKQNGRWKVILRFGRPCFLRDFSTSEQLIHAVEAHVHELSDREFHSDSVTFPEALHYEIDGI